MDDLVNLARSEAAALISRDRVRNGSDEASELRQSPEYRAAKTLEQAAAEIARLRAKVAKADALSEVVYDFNAGKHLTFGAVLKAADAYRDNPEGVSK